MSYAVTVQTGPNTSSHDTLSSGPAFAITVAGAARLEVAAGEDLCSGRASLLDPGEHASRAPVDQRPDVGRLVGRVAGARPPPWAELLEQLVVGVSLDVDALDGDAALAGEGESVRGEPRAASSRSASASTITGVAFPSSSFTRLRGARSAASSPPRLSR